MSDKLMPDGPFEIDLKVHFLIGDDSGVATIELPPGRYPSAGDIAVAIRKVCEALPDDAALMGRHAFMRGLVGMNVSVPGPDKFSTDWAR